MIILIYQKNNKARLIAPSAFQRVLFCVGANSLLQSLLDEQKGQASQVVKELKCLSTSAYPSYLLGDYHIVAVSLGSAQSSLTV
jgi:hypothetical protein